MCSRYTRIAEEIDRRLDQIGGAEEHAWMVRYVEEVAEDHYREWLRDRITEEVNEDAMEYGT